MARPGTGVPAHKVAGSASARKMLDVLFCFSEEAPLWTVVELCEKLDVSTSTMYRYIALLREVGLLTMEGVNSYRMSPRVLTLAAAALAGRSSLEDVALPVMTRIRDVTDETVLLARRNRDHAYCVDRVESRKPVRLQFDRGQPMSLHLGSLARVLLAGMTPAERERYLSSVGELPGTASTLLDRTSLDEVAANGYTQSFEEVEEGIWGTAAAIVVRGITIAAVGVAAPIYRLDARMREKIIAEVRTGAAEISDSLDLVST